MFTSQLDEHDTQGWEQVECPKRRNSDKLSNLQTPKTKLVETKITEQAKEASFKKILEKIENDELMGIGNTDANDDDDDDTDDDNNDDNDVDNDVGMDADDTNDETENDQIEKFPDDLSRSTHSYKNEFLTKIQMNMKGPSEFQSGSISKSLI